MCDSELTHVCVFCVLWRLSCDSPVVSRLPFVLSCEGKQEELSQSSTPIKHLLLQDGQLLSAVAFLLVSSLFVEIRSERCFHVAGVSKLFAAQKMNLSA